MTNLRSLSTKRDMKAEREQTERKIDQLIASLSFEERLVLQRKLRGGDNG